MAEITGLRNVALPYPVYGVPFGVTFPILDADGDLVTGATGLDSERSLNGDTFSDCTNEATEIATNSGTYYLLLTAAEMTADVVTVIVKTSSSGAKTTVLTLNPRKLAALSSGTAQGSNDTGDIILASGDSPVNDIYNGCLIVATIDTVVEARIINDYVGSSKTAEVSPAFVTATPDSDDTYVIYLPEGRSVGAANVFAVSDDMTAADNLESACDNYSATRGLAGTALPNAAADAAGGLPISDAGGLDLDAKLANTNEVTVARMGALTDWINGGRLDLILDDILLDTGTTLQAEVDGIQADTEDIQSRLPAALVSGRIDASVGAMAANTLTAAAVATGAIDADALAADAVDEIWDEVMEGAITARQSIRGHNSILMAPASGLNGGTRTYRDYPDTKDRAVWTIGASTRTVVWDLT